MTDRVIPFSSAAQAYGQTRPLSARPVAQVRAVQRAEPRDTMNISEAARARTRPTHPLAAARVPVPVRFDGDVPAPAAGALTIYRHPADRNIAATGVNAGRLIDAQA